MNEAAALHAAALAAAAEAADSLVCSLMAPVMVTVLQSGSVGGTALDASIQNNGHSLVAKTTKSQVQTACWRCVYRISAVV